MKKTFTIRVRHNKSHAVFATVREVEDGFVLEAVTPLSGPLPEVGHLLGEQFTDLGAVRRALVVAMSGVVGDTLDNVRLSIHAYNAWMEKAVQAARMLPPGTDPESIPNERVKPIEGGRLLIWVDMPNGRRVELIVPKGQWDWISRPN